MIERGPLAFLLCLKQIFVALACGNRGICSVSIRVTCGNFPIALVIYRLNR